MFQFINKSLHKLSKLIVLIGALAIVPATAALAYERDCSYATPVDLNSTLRGYGSEADKVQLFSIDVPEAGIVTIDVNTAGGSHTFPKLGYLGERCQTASMKSRSSTIIGRLATNMVLDVEAPGTYYFRVAAQDPSLTLGSFKITAKYMATYEFGSFDRVEEEEEVDPDPNLTIALGPGGADKVEEEEEVDPDPNLTIGLKPGGADKVEEEEEVDPDPNLTIALGPGGADKVEEEEEVDPDPNLTIGPRSGFHVESICDLGEVDDHGNTFACATPLALGQNTVGQIDNDWGDDGDLFRLTVSQTTTVYFESYGTTDTFGELYDRFGQRLDMADGGGTDLNFRIVRTLSAGQYFIRVTGSQDTEGSYDLMVGGLDW